MYRISKFFSEKTHYNLFESLSGYAARAYGVMPNGPLREEVQDRTVMPGCAPRATMYRISKIFIEKTHCNLLLKVPSNYLVMKAIGE